MKLWPYPRIVAHRGGGTLAPENTLAAIRHGASLGFKGVEFDVRLTADRVLVLSHDDELARTTNGRGKISQTPYAALATLDAGAWAGEQWRGERIPTFDEAAGLCRELGLWANVEIKAAMGAESESGTLVARKALVLWRDAQVPCLLSSFSAQALLAARAVAPALPRGYIARRAPQEWKAILRRLGCVSIHCKHQLLERGQAEEIRAEGYALACWTLKDAVTARKFVEWGADCLIADALDQIGPDFAHVAP